MSEQFALTAESRTDLGKAASRRLRRLQDRVPAVVYGANQEPVHITLTANKVNKALENEGFYSQVLTMSIDGKSEKVILKALQRHPYKPKVVHMDFFRIRADEKLNVTVPIHFLGEEEAPGLKEGGAITHHINELEISCLPANIPTSIEVDISKMAMDDVIHLSQLNAPKGVEILLLAGVTDDAHDHAVVSIHPPRAMAEPVEDEVEAGEVEATESGQKSEESSSKE